MKRRLQIEKMHNAHNVNENPRTDFALQFVTVYDWYLELKKKQNQQTA